VSTLTFVCRICNLLTCSTPLAKEIDDNDIKTFPELQQEWSRAVPVEMALGDADFIHPEARARPVVAI
jgi:hypothetical protein